MSGVAGAHPTQVFVRQRQHGIVCAILTAALFSGSDALIKQLVAVAPFLLLLWLRYIFQAGLLAAWLLGKRRRWVLHPGSWGLQGLRCVLLVASSLCGYLALQHVPLAEYTALMMLAPVVSVVLGRLTLNERVSTAQWLCVALGVAGMLAVVRPGWTAWSAQAWLPVLSACSYSAFQLASRRVLLKADLLTSNLLSALFIVVAIGLLLAWARVDWNQVRPHLTAQWWGLFGLMCLFATAGQVTLAAALQKTKVSVVAPFAYLQIVFAVLVGLGFFGQWPDHMALAGMALIAVAGMGSAWFGREAR